MCLLTFDKLIILLFGFLIWIIGNVCIRIIYSFLRNYYVVKKADLPYQRSVALLGYLESIAYAIAYSMGANQFILVWLGLKAIGRWSSAGPESIVNFIDGISNLEKRERKNAEINIYLIGNLLSVGLGVLVGWIFKL